MGSDRIAGDYAFLDVDRPLREKNGDFGLVRGFPGKAQ
jgi:hypothetical protein